MPGPVSGGPGILLCTFADLIHKGLEETLLVSVIAAVFGEWPSLPVHLVTPLSHAVCLPVKSDSLFPGLQNVSCKARPVPYQAQTLPLKKGPLVHISVIPPWSPVHHCQ